VIVGRIGPASSTAENPATAGAAQAQAAPTSAEREPSLHEVVRMRMMPADAPFGSRRVQRVPPSGTASPPPASAAYEAPPGPPESLDLSAVLSKEELAALLNPDDGVTGEQP